MTIWAMLRQEPGHDGILAGFFGLHHDAIGPDRFGDTLDAMRSRVFIFRWYLAFDQVIGVPGNADASRIRQPLQQYGDIDSITPERAFFFRHLPEVNPDPEQDSVRFRNGIVPCLQLVLDPNSALHGVHRASELSEQASPRRIHDAAPVCLDERGHRLMMALQGGKGPRFILSREPAGLHSAGTKDGGELSLLLFRGHRISPDVST